jgi:hypothetical protein
MRAAEERPDEVSALFRELLIGVTVFFRDATAGREYPRGTNQPQ